MRISDWSSDVCSSDLAARTKAFFGKRTGREHPPRPAASLPGGSLGGGACETRLAQEVTLGAVDAELHHLDERILVFDLLHHHAQAALLQPVHQCLARPRRSEEHTSELQSLMRISYAVYCLKKQQNTINIH